MAKSGDNMHQKNILRMIISERLSESELKRALKILACDRSGELESIFSSAYELQRRLGISRMAADAIARTDAEAAYAELKKLGIDMITEIDREYPPMLKAVLGSNCPAVIFTIGNKQLLYGKSVGFTGSRNISPRGRSVAESAAKQLAQRGITVVSGYAPGSDMCAHTAALKNCGNTVFVLAEGIMNMSLKGEIIDLISSGNSLFISQFTPRAKWCGPAALRRNETIIGLSQSVILTEAANRSGTFSTGYRTLKFNHPLFVIDYAAPPSTAAANRQLIENGGIPLRGRNGVPDLSRVFETVDKLYLETMQGFDLRA